MRWNLLKEIIEIRSNHSARGKADYPSKEASWQTLAIEMMAQLGGLLAGAHHHFTKDVIFAKLEFVHFYNELIEGVELDIQVQADQVDEHGGWMSGSIFQNGQKVCDAKLLLMTVGFLNENQSQSVTFHADFMKHYQIQEKVMS